MAISGWGGLPRHVEHCGFAALGPGCLIILSAPILSKQLFLPQQLARLL
jgi:hypothetical protein